MVIGGRDQLDQVFVAFLVFAQQDEMVVAVVNFGLLFAVRLRDVDLAAEDGFDAFGLGLGIEFDRAEQVAMIGHRDGRHFLLGHHVHQLADLTGPIEKRIVGVAVEVYERDVRHREIPV